MLWKMEKWTEILSTKAAVDTHWNGRTLFPLPAAFCYIVEAKHKQDGCAGSCCNAKETIHLMARPGSTRHGVSGMPLRSRVLRTGITETLPDHSLFSYSATKSRNKIGITLLTIAIITTVQVGGLTVKLSKSAKSVQHRGNAGDLYSLAAEAFNPRMARRPTNSGS
jgi:hypothetical protein